MKIYHGSYTVVGNPKILTDGFYKDFGFGFYCTNKENQAKKWARTKKQNHVVNIYHYEEDKSLKIRHFQEMSEEWLDFVVACRQGKEHDYDIVEGPMADDTIWDYIEDFVDGTITKEAFWVLVKFKYPTHQIVFCSNAALETIKYEGSYTV